MYTKSIWNEFASKLILLVAASGGIYLFMKDLKNHYFKFWILVVHASFGFFGIIWPTFQQAE